MFLIHTSGTEYSCDLLLLRKKLRYKSLKSLTSLNKTNTEYGYVLIGDNTISTKSDRRQCWSLNIIFHSSFYIFEPSSASLHQSNYRQVSNINRTSVGNKNVDRSDVVGAGAAPTTSSFST